LAFCNNIISAEEVLLLLQKSVTDDVMFMLSNIQYCIDVKVLQNSWDLAFCVWNLLRYLACWYYLYVEILKIFAETEQLSQIIYNSTFLYFSHPGVLDPFCTIICTVSPGYIAALIW